MHKLFLLWMFLFCQTNCSDIQVSYHSFAPINEDIENSKTICKLFLFETSAKRNGSFLSYNYDEDNRFLQFYIRRKNINNPSATINVPLIKESQKLIDVFDFAKKHREDLKINKYILTAIFRQSPQPLKLIYADFKEGSNQQKALQTPINPYEEFLFFLEKGEYQVSEQIPHFNDDDNKNCCCGCQ